MYNRNAREEEEEKTVLTSEDQETGLGNQLSRGECGTGLGIFGLLKEVEDVFDLHVIPFGQALQGHLATEGFVSIIGGRQFAEDDLVELQPGYPLHVS